MTSQRAPDAARSALDDVERDVRDGDARPAGSRSASASPRRASTSTPFARAFARVASTAASSMSTPMTGAKPSRAAAIESTPEPQPTSSRRRRLELLQQLEAEPRRRMRARAERAAGIDRRPASAPAAASSQGGPTQSGPTATGVVELAPARPPSLLDARRATRRGSVAEPLLAACVGVGRELDAVGLDLLEPFREELEQRARSSSALAADGDAAARISGTRSSASRRSPRRAGTCARRVARRTPRAAGAARR